MESSISSEAQPDQCMANQGVEADVSSSSELALINYSPVHHHIDQPDPGKFHIIGLQSKPSLIGKVCSMRLV